MKKIIPILIILLLIPLVAYAAVGDENSQVSINDDLEEESLYDDQFNKLLDEDIYQDVNDVQLSGKAGLTPDSSFYFLESMVENILVGDDPKAALAYKEEKILELQEMIDSDNSDGAHKALERVKKYNEIIKKEVSPDIEKEVRESSKAVKVILDSFEGEIEGREWEDVQSQIDDNLKLEDKIALAAKVSSQIKDLCEALSGLDPLQYSQVCKTDDDAPEWKRELDRDLTLEQEKEAKEFFEIMSVCFENPAECRCDDISIIPFAKQCSIIAPLAAECEAGNENACEEMENVGDIIDLLPDYLQDVMEDVEDRYGDAKHDLHLPSECAEQGATSKEECMKVMFELNAPPECLEALEDGRIDPKNERDAKKACEEIMFDLEAPEECKEAGLRDHRECERMMFKLDSPQECLDAGLTGSGRDDRRKCDAIRFKLDAPQECLDAGIDGSNRDDWKKCEAIKFQMDSPQECLDAGLDGSGRDDWRKCDAIRFQTEAHPDCLAAGLDGSGRNDWDECSKIQFRSDAPEECIAAGLDGSGRRDWDECNKIRENTDTHGQSKEDCVGDQLYICDDNGQCYCVFKEEYDEKQGYDNDDHGGDDSGSGIDCAAIYCAQGDECIDGVGCVSSNDGGDYEESQCKDGCSQECPGADRTDCVDNGMRCECYYEQHDDETDNSGDGGIDNSGPSDDSSDDGSQDQPEEEPQEQPQEQPEEQPEESQEQPQEQPDEPEESNEDSGEITGGLVGGQIPEDNFLGDFLQRFFYG
jgi:hypothetical protein